MTIARAFVAGTWGRAKDLDDVAAPGAGRARSARRRRPAPRVVRAADLLLVLVLVGCLAGLVVGRVRPSWLAPLRASEVSARPLASSSAAGKPAAAAAPAGASSRGAEAPARRGPPAAASKPVPGLVLQSATPTTAVFRLPVRAYTVSVEVAAPCWVRLRSLAVPASVFEATLLPRSLPNGFAVRGPTTVMVAARAVAIRISAGGRLVGRIDAPVVGLTYEFVPTGDRAAVPAAATPAVGRGR